MNSCFYTITDLAERWGCSTKTVRRHLDAAGVAPKRQGMGKRLISMAELAELERIRDGQLETLDISVPCSALGRRLE